MFLFFSSEIFWYLVSFDKIVVIVVECFYNIFDIVLVQVYAGMPYAFSKAVPASVTQSQSGVGGGMYGSSIFSGMNV